MKCFGSLSVSLILLVTGILACSRSGSDNPPGNGPHIIDFNDNTNPVVVINTPLNNEVFSSGNVIRVSGRVDDNSLYRGFIRITNDADNSIVKEQLYEIHGFQFYNFSLEYTTSVAVASDYTITVQFEDHGLNPGSKTLKVKMNP